MKPRTFILNGKTAIMQDYKAPNNSGMKFEFYGVKQMQEAFDKLIKAGKMEGQDLKEAVNVLQYHAKPIVRKMKSLAPKSKRMASVTMHRTFSKGAVKTIERVHKAGELKRSIGTLKSKRYKKLPLIYVGVRTGVKYKNSGNHAFMAEFGRKAITALTGKYLFFANKDGSVVKTKRVSGFSGRFFFKKAMEAEGDKAIENIMGSFAYFFGGIWENPKSKALIKPR